MDSEILVFSFFGKIYFLKVEKNDVELVIHRVIDLFGY